MKSRQLISNVIKRYLLLHYN